MGGDPGKGIAVEMTLPLFFRAEIQSDLSDAFDWYEARREGLGMEFLSCVDAAVENIRRNPTQYPVVHRLSIRRALVRRFPYGIFYAVEQDHVLVYALSHLKRDPASVSQRLLQDKRPDGQNP
jgi:toxin ParE1/3/4